MPFQDLFVGSRRRVQSDNVIRDAFGGTPSQPNAITNAFGSAPITTFSPTFFGPSGLATGVPVSQSFDARGGQPNPTVNTTNVDGQARFVNALSGLGASLLERIGGRRDAPAPTIQPAGFIAAGTGPSLGTIALIGGAVFGGYYLLNR